MSDLAVGRALHIALVLLTLAAGCYLSHERPRPAADTGPPDAGPPDAGPADGGMDARPAEDAWTPPDAAVDAVRECDGGTIPGPVSDVSVDLLFVVDNSGSMSEEQLSLIAQFPRMVTILGSGDLEGDGVEDFPPVRSLRVGVITTDLGGGEVMGAGCPPLGDDAILRSGRVPPPMGCGRTYPKFTTFRPDGDVPLEEFAQDFRCVAQVGIAGCGIEQPLEAALKALTPSTSDLTFAGGTTGHGDGENDGFLRRDAVLGIILVTDEDDCSIADGDLFNPESTRYEGLLRCFLYEREALHPISRFLEGYRRIESDPDRLVVAAIAGVPPDLLTPGVPPDYAAILSDPRMVRRIDPDDSRQLAAACEVEGRVRAVPPRRILEVLQSFGPSGTVQSICQESFDGALVGIIERLGRAIRRVECRE